MAAKVAGVVRQVAGGRQPLSRPVVDCHYWATGYWRYITLTADCFSQSFTDSAITSGGLNINSNSGTEKGPKSGEEPNK